MRSEVLSSEVKQALHEDLNVHDSVNVLTQRFLLRVSYRRRGLDLDFPEGVGVRRDRLLRF